jgi:hypothetical protein
VPLRAANSDTSQSARSLTYIQISPHESRPCRGSGNEPPVSMSMLSAAKASQLTISVGPIGLSCFENGRSAGKRMNTPGDRIWSVACHPCGAEIDKTIHVLGPTFRVWFQIAQSGGTCISFEPYCGVASAS